MPLVRRPFFSCCRPGFAVRGVAQAIREVGKQLRPGYKPSDADQQGREVHHRQAGDEA